MPPSRQLELDLAPNASFPVAERKTVVGRTPVRLGPLRLPNLPTASGALALQLPAGRDHALERKARELLHANGAGRIASDIRVEWNSRLTTSAGRADYKSRMISLNALLHGYGPEEIDRTFRHELAHLLAQFRAGRRRILAHGREWRRACKDLGIGDEKRCHTLPLPVRTRARRFLYKCPNCKRDFPRTRKIGRAIACLACCRTYNRGKFDQRFRLRLAPCSGGL